MKGMILAVVLAFSSGCAANTATVAKAPVAGPLEDCPAYLAPGAMADCLAGYVECGDGPQTGVCDPDLETRCMARAELAYERAAGHAMSSLGDAPVPDAAYEDAYARCMRAEGK